MLIAIALFDGVTALDAIGPYEILSRLPCATIQFVAAEPGVKRNDRMTLGLVADHELDEVPRCDVVVVPGGPGHDSAAKDERLLDWLRRVDETTSFTAAVCTGTLILGAAGLLRGRRATTHWLSVDALAGVGAVHEDARVVIDGKYVTAAGVSSGIDMALALSARLADERVAQAIQLSVEYDPQPPFNAGSPATAPAEVVELVRAIAERHRATTGA
jgi:transcriptional regulator GlxA family with amidase domain